MTILTAQVAQVNFPVKEGFVEGLMDEEGRLYVGVSQMCEVFAIPLKNSTRDFKRVLGREYEFTKLHTPLNSKPVNGITIEDLEKLIVSLAGTGNEKAREILGIARPLKGKNKNKEKSIQAKLHHVLGGKIEVECLAGRIDLLTSSEIIEIKKVSDWKGGIGQVLVYSQYYPSHCRRLHLFGETQQSYLEMIGSHCDTYNISLTWEP